MSQPTVRSVRYSTTAADLDAAWAFVGEHLAEFVEPHITIAPRQVCGPNWHRGQPTTLVFDVIVEGVGA